MKAEVQDSHCIALVPETAADREALQNMIDRQREARPYGSCEPMVYWGDVRIEGREMTAFKINYHAVPPANWRAALKIAIEHLVERVLWKRPTHATPLLPAARPQ